MEDASRQQEWHWKEPEPVAPALAAMAAPFTWAIGAALFAALGAQGTAPLIGGCAFAVTVTGAVSVVRTRSLSSVLGYMGATLLICGVLLACVAAGAFVALHGR